jgi:hypothetical protein
VTPFALGALYWWRSAARRSRSGSLDAAGEAAPGANRANPTL